MVTALTFCYCGSGSIHRLGITCGLSFPSLKKPTPQIPINFDLETMDKRSQEWNVHCLIPIYLFLPIEMERATIEKQVLVCALIL